MGHIYQLVIEKMKDNQQYMLNSKYNLLKYKLKVLLNVLNNQI